MAVVAGDSPLSVHFKQQVGQGIQRGLQLTVHRLAGHLSAFAFADVIDHGHDVIDAAIGLAHTAGGQARVHHMAIFVDETLVQGVAADFAAHQAAELRQVRRQVFGAGQRCPGHAGQFVPRVSQRRAKCIVDLEPAFFRAGDGEAHDGMVEVGVKALHTGGFRGSHCMLRQGQSLLVNQLLFVIAKNQAQQHGGERVEQQDHPPSLLNEGITGPIRDLREQCQLHQLNHQAQRQIVTRLWRDSAAPPPLPCQHPQQSRLQCDHDADRRTAATQLVAIQGSHGSGNQRGHTATHHTDH